MLSFPLRKKRYSILREGTDVAHLSKTFKPLPDIILLCQGYCLLVKKHKQGIHLRYGFYIRPSSALNLQLVFGFNQSL